MDDTSADSEAFLDVRGDEFDGYVIIGNSEGLEHLVSASRDAASSSDGLARIGLPGSAVVAVNRTRRPTTVAEPSRLRRLSGTLVGVFLLLFLAVALLRGCVALQNDVERYFERQHASN
jgi:hypothetical protein